MAVKLLDMYVDIEADGKKAANKAASDIEGSGAGERAGSGFGKRLAGGLIAAVAAVGIGQFLGSAIMAGSDLNETISKSRAIFGEQAAGMESWASTAATSMGLSKSAALAASAGFGDMFTQIGFTGDAAATMSQSVVQAAADLGSFSNLETADVADRISAAFRGEYDSLQAVIPNINAARVESEAMAATGKTTASALTAQEKATAVLAIVNQDGARAMGDFGRTSDGFANQMKIASAQTEDLKGKIGSALQPALQAAAGVLTGTLLPAVTGFVDKAAPVIETFFGSTLPGLAGTIGPALAPIGAAIGTVASSFGAGFAPFLEPLMSIGAQLLPVFASLMTAVSPFGILLQALAPIAGTVGSVLGSVATTIGTALLTNLTTLQPFIATLSASLSTGLATILPVILGLLPPIATLFGTLAGVVSQVLAAVMPLVSSLIAMLVPALTAIIAAVLPVVSSLVSLISVAIVPIVTALLGILMPAIQALMPVVQAVFGIIVGVITSAMQIIQGIIQVVTGIITGNWSQVWAGLGNIVSGAWNLISGLVTGAINLVKSIVIAGINLVKNQWSGAWSAISGVVSSVAGAIGGAVGNLVSSVRSGISNVVSFFTSLPGTIMGAVSGFGTMLFSSGAKIMQGLIDGIKSAVGKVKDAVGDVMSAARNLLPFSPAKEGPFSGKGWSLYSGMSIGSALADGMRSRVTVVRNAATDMVSAASVGGSLSTGRAGVSPLAFAGTGGGNVTNNYTVTVPVTAADNPTLYGNRTARAIVAGLI